MVDSTVDRLVAVRAGRMVGSSVAKKVDSKVDHSDERKAVNWVV
jgi:hypothetical protein